MTQSAFIRRALVGVLLLGVVAAWSFLAATFLLDLDRAWRIAAALTAALATEAFFWVGAGLLGWKAFESRKAIWRRLTGGRAV
ncbi:MAG: hypothetical protein ACFE0P_10135 [Oceanicaulis sp.]